MDAAGVSDSAIVPASRPSRQNRVRAAGVFLLGLIVIGFLTRYNATGYSIWWNATTRIARSWDEYLLVNMTGILFLPCLLALGVYREPLSEYGFAPPTPNGVAAGVPARLGRQTWSRLSASQYAALFYLVMLPVLLYAARQPDFYNNYPLFPVAAFAWKTLIAYEVTYGFYFFCWEFFYRGFLTFGLGRGIGFPAAILLQAVGFGIMHWGKPTPEFYSSFAGGLILGWLAVRGRSFLPCFWLHWAVSVTLDLLAIHVRHTGLV